MVAFKVKLALKPRPRRVIGFSVRSNQQLLPACPNMVHLWFRQADDNRNNLQAHRNILVAFVGSLCIYFVAS